MRWPKLKIKNRKTTVFLVCVSISAFLWLLIKLSKEYEITVEIPIKYTNFPKDKLITNQPDSVLLLKYTDNGFELAPYSLFGKLKRLKIDVQSLDYREQSNAYSLYYIKTEMLAERINKLIKSQNFISIIRPDSLKIRMIDLEEKKVKVIPNIQYSLSPQFQLKEHVYTNPDSIIIYGSLEQLSEIDSVSTKKLKFNNLNSSIFKKTNILFPPNINSDIKTVSVNLVVEKFTESSILIPLRNHFSTKGKFKIFPNHLDIKYAVSFDNFEKISAEDFIIEVQKDSLTKGRLNIKLLEYPSYIRVIDYSPKMAEYIIIK